MRAFLLNLLILNKAFGEVSFWPVIIKNIYDSGFFRLIYHPFKLVPPLSALRNYEQPSIPLIAHLKLDCLGSFKPISLDRFI